MRAMMVLTVATMCSCGGAATPIDEDAVVDGDADVDTDVDADAEADLHAGDADEEPPEGGPYCECSTDMPPPDQPTFMFHPCVPPLLFGCGAQACTPGRDDCPEGMSCDEWGAAACCFCSSVVPACVPTGPLMGPLPEYLALNPPYGPAGQEQEIDVIGFPFYVGAIGYFGRIGSSGDVFQVGGEPPCSLRFRAPARPAGTVPVWVSQYGGDEPWVLAGFFAYGADVATCIQPGYPCGDGTTVACCETPDVPMSCRSGRCLRE